MTAFGACCLCFHRCLAFSCFILLLSLTLESVIQGQHFPSWPAVLEENIVSNLNTVKFIAHQKYFLLLDILGKKIPEIPRQHVPCLVAPITSAGH